MPSRSASPAPSDGPGGPSSAATRSSPPPHWSTSTAPSRAAIRSSPPSPRTVSRPGPPTSTSAPARPATTSRPGPPQSRFARPSPSSVSRPEAAPDVLDVVELVVLARLAAHGRLAREVDADGVHALGVGRRCRRRRRRAADRRPARPRARRRRGRAGRARAGVGRREVVAGELVVAGEAAQHVAAVAAVEAVGERRADEPVVARAAEHDLDVGRDVVALAGLAVVRRRRADADRRRPPCARGRTRCPGRRRPGACRRRGRRQRVVAGAAREQVRTVAAGQHVAPVAALAAHGEARRRPARRGGRRPGRARPAARTAARRSRSRRRCRRRPPLRTTTVRRPAAGQVTVASVAVAVRGAAGGRREQRAREVGDRHRRGGAVVAHLHAVGLGGRRVGRRAVRDGQGRRRRGRHGQREDGEGHGDSTHRGTVPAAGADDASV